MTIHTHHNSQDNPFEPLPTLQLGSRVYQALLDKIVSGQFEFGVPLRPDAIARQLSVSTTPVREALHRLESSNLVVKHPNQGWVVRTFTKQQIRELYEFRAALESFSVRLACERRTDEDVAALRAYQLVGERALENGDTNSYRIYNRDLHAAYCRAARNSYVSTVMGQVGLQSEMLSSKTIRMAGRPSRGIEEHSRLTEFIASRDASGASALMEHHILSALDDILRLGLAEGISPLADAKGL
jgi:DNA-binding GntR family transcriptional regulator